MKLFPDYMRGYNLSDKCTLLDSHAAFFLRTCPALAVGFVLRGEKLSARHEKLLKNHCSGQRNVHFNVSVIGRKYVCFHSFVFLILRFRRSEIISWIKQNILLTSYRIIKNNFCHLNALSSRMMLILFVIWHSLMVSLW